MKRRRVAFYRRARAWGWCSLVVGLWSATACEPSDPTPAGRGARIFQRTCSGCHGADGKGTLRPGLTKPPRDLTNVEFQSVMSNDQLRQSIRVGKGQMPAFGGLMDDEELGNVIAFVRTLVPPGSLPPGVIGLPSATPLPAPGVVAPPAAAPPAAAEPTAAPPAAPTAQGVRTP